MVASIFIFQRLEGMASIFDRRLLLSLKSLSLPPELSHTHLCVFLVFILKHGERDRMNDDDDGEFTEEEEE